MSSRKLAKSVIVGSAAIAVAGVPTIVSAASSSSNSTAAAAAAAAAASKATEAALAAYPGGVVDRVVQLSNGEYEVHNIGVSWPHHVFVNQDFQVIGAD
jgi:hypothetical protein